MSTDNKDVSIDEGGDSMTALAEYLKENKEKAYKVATANTTYNNDGRPVIAKDDEWANESEWDDLFTELCREKGVIHK